MADALGVGLELVLPGASLEELGQVTRTVRQELAEQPLERVELVRAGAIPEGGKAADVVTLGALAIVVLPTVLPKIVAFLEHWTLRKRGLTIKLKIAEGDKVVEIELPMTDDAQARLDQIVTTAKRAIAE